MRKLIPMTALTIAAFAGSTALQAQDTTPSTGTADTMQQQSAPGTSGTMGNMGGQTTDTPPANTMSPGETMPGAMSSPGNMAPPPADAMNKSYPVCTSKMQDSCQNPGEGGAPGRSRASDHKGGRPAYHHRRHR